MGGGTSNYTRFSASLLGDRRRKHEAAKKVDRKASRESVSHQDHVVLLHKLAMGIYPPSDLPRASWSIIDVLMDILSKPGLHIDSVLDDNFDPADFTGSLSKPFLHVTPLMQAVLYKNAHVVYHFIEYGADTNAVLPCDIPYPLHPNAPNSVLPAGSSVFMLALYMLSEAVDHIALNKNQLADNESTHPGSERGQPQIAQQRILQHQLRDAAAALALDNDADDATNNHGGTGTAGELDRDHSNVLRQPSASSRTATVASDSHPPTNWSKSYLICYRLLHSISLDIRVGCYITDDQFESPNTIASRIGEKLHSISAPGAMITGVKKIVRMVDIRYNHAVESGSYDRVTVTSRTPLRGPFFRTTNWRDLLLLGHEAFPPDDGYNEGRFHADDDSFDYRMSPIGLS
jgi:hypothetical protein